MDAYTVNYDSTNWPNPETFDPERFADGKNHAPYSFFRFGLGPRKCLGYRLASSIVGLLTAKVLQRFFVTTVQEDAELRVKSEGMPFFTPYVPPPLIFSERLQVHKDKF